MNINESIIKVFHSLGDKYISGAELAEKLNVSRATVWNHIKYLRQQGYRFKASTHVGYKLLSVPDRMLPDEIQYELGTRFIGRKKIYSYQEVNSTNDIAIDLASQNAEEGTVVFAEHQRKGRGRFHRRWFSPPTKNILCSIILRPHFQPKKITQLTITAAVAVANSIRSYFDLPALIKWPNDIYIRGKKAGGILIEMNAELDEINFVIVGIGVNVNILRKDIPKSLIKNCTSTRIEAGKKCNRVEFAKALLREFEKQYTILLEDGFDRIGKEWVDLSLTLGKMIEAMTEGEAFVGYPTGLDEDGGLLLRLDTGIIKKVAGGDIRIL